MKIQGFIFKFLLLTFILGISQTAKAEYSALSRPHTAGLTFYGNFQLIDTQPELKPGLGGGFWWDYRFNDRFSFQMEIFIITQKGKDTSSAENNIELIGIPTTTLKLYVLNRQYSFDPYVGAGLGVYWLNEGSVDNDTGGMGIGAQIELGSDYHFTDSFMGSLGVTYRSVGLINSLDGPANGSAYMTLSVFGRLGYRF